MKLSELVVAALPERQGGLLRATAAVTDRNSGKTRVLSAVVVLLAVLGRPASAVDIVDFRYSPPEWQTAICLPDDPHKSLVDKSGALLYHYKQGGREFGTRVAVEVASDAVWQKQELHSPRVPIVKTYRAADGLRIVEEAFAVNAPARTDWILVHATNTGQAPRTLQLKLIVDTKLGLRFADELVVVNINETIATSLKMTGVVQEKEVELEPLTVPAGQTAEFSVCYSSLTVA